MQALQPTVWPLPASTPTASRSAPTTRSALATLAAVVLAGCAAVPSGELPASVAAVHASTGVPLSSLAVVAYPLDTARNPALNPSPGLGQGQALAPPARGLRLNADRPMQGASTMKLLTAAAALDRLGPNSRGRTELLVEGDPSATPTPPAPDGHLRAPLYLKGGADADLDWSALWLMLRELRERQGVSALDGGVVVDRTMFRPARPELGAPAFDEQPEFPYNVIPDALNLNGSLLSFDLATDGKSGPLQPTAPAAPAAQNGQGVQGVQVRPFPMFGGLDIDAAQLGLADVPCKDWDDHWQIPEFQPQPDTQPPASGARLVLRGSFPRDCQVRQSLNVVDRQWLTAQAIRQLWTSLGGTLSGDIREGQAPALTRVLVRHQDRPLAELLRPVLKASDNATTRLIFQRLGAATAQPGEDTLPAAQRAVKEWVRTVGVDPSDVVLENGAGLSRIERISAAKMATLLAAVQRGRHGPEFLATLPVAGVDGTLARRFKGTPAEGRARMKTGTLRDVVALAGYVPDASGRLWVVVAVVNDERASAARPTLDALVSWVAAQ